MRTQSFRLAALSMAVLSGGCGAFDGGAPEASGRHGQGPLSEVSASLLLPDDAEIATVHYIVTRPGFTRTGQVPVGNSSTLSFRVGDLPIAPGYTIALSATTNFGAPCTGSTTFAVLDNDVTPISLTLTCTATDDKGEVIVNGQVLSCPLVTSLEALPAEARVGYTMAFAAWLSHGDSEITWSATSGTFSSPTGYETTYTCVAPGVHTITAQVTGAGPNCDDTLTMTVECSELRCGDGIVSGSEECDDGDADNTDACTTACKFPVCGDGYVQDGEQCDDGDGIDDNACSNDCMAGAECGDGAVQASEWCDDGNTSNTDDCTNLCQAPACGDGFVQAGEQCDDANAIETDFCLSDCTLPVCGDGIVQADEGCDDGNTDDFDGCTNDCQAIVFCPGPPGLDAFPAEVYVGFTMDFTAYVGFGNGSVAWSGEGGFSPQVGLSTVYTCTTPGIHTITATLVGVPVECLDSASMQVECTALP